MQWEFDNVTRYRLSKDLDVSESHISDTSVTLFTLQAWTYLWNLPTTSTSPPTTS